MAALNYNFLSPDYHLSVALYGYSYCPYIALAIVAPFVLGLPGRKKGPFEKQMGREMLTHSSDCSLELNHPLTRKALFFSYSERKKLFLGLTSCSKGREFLRSLQEARKSHVYTHAPGGSTLTPIPTRTVLLALRMRRR
jgi:hypothetical protein